MVSYSILINVAQKEKLCLLEVLGKMVSTLLFRFEPQVLRVLRSQNIFNIYFSSYLCPFY